MSGALDRRPRPISRASASPPRSISRADELWVRSKLPHQDIWHELRGTAVIPLEFGEHHAYQSISKTKTFTPPTSDREMLLAQLSKNVENACIARRHKLEARRVSFFCARRISGIRGMSWSCHGRPMSPASSCRSSTRTWTSSTARSCAIGSRAWCSRTCAARATPSSIPWEALRAERVRRIYDGIDRLDAKYGKHTVFLGSSFPAMQGQQHTATGRNSPPSAHVAARRE